MEHTIRHTKGEFSVLQLLGNVAHMTVIFSSWTLRGVGAKGSQWETYKGIIESFWLSFLCASITSGIDCFLSGLYLYFHLQIELFCLKL
jgi:hypothetical protein